MPVKVPMGGSLMREMVLFACTACLSRIWLMKGTTKVCPACGKGLMLLEAGARSPGWVRG